MKDANNKALFKELQKVWLQGVNGVQQGHTGAPRTNFVLVFAQKKYLHVSHLKSLSDFLLLLKARIF